MSDVSAGYSDAPAPAIEAPRLKPDGKADPAGEAGWYLMRERERRGETIDEAGNATGIHPYHIEAIEWGDMTHMPARLDALEMIGVYAQYLGFDPEPLVRHYMKFLPKPAVAPLNHPANPAPLTSAKVLAFGKLPKLPQFNFSMTGIPGGTSGLIAGLAGAVFLFAGAAWFVLPHAERSQAVIADTQPSSDPMPTASTDNKSADVGVTDEPMTDDQQQADANAPAGGDQADGSTVVDAQPVPPPTAASGGDDTAGTDLDGITQLINEKVKPGKIDPTKPVATAAAAKPAKALPAATVASADDMTLTPGGREFGAKTGGMRLMLKARAPVWVRIEDRAGKVVMTQMLQKGDTYRVPDRDGLVVIARDGSLISYLIDGKEKGVLGGPGEILTGRSLDLKELNGKG